MSSPGLTSLNNCFAKGGPVIGTNSRFLKTPDSFRSSGNAKQDYASKGGNKPKDKSQKPILPK